MMGLSSSKSFSLTQKSTTPRDVLDHLAVQHQFASFVQQQQQRDDDDDDDEGVRRGTAVVTGGNSGIGAITVEYLARAGLQVVLCTRNVEATQRDVWSSSSWPPDMQQRVRVQYLDLADLNAVRQTARDILQQYDRIDCLVCNAGIMALPERKETPQGIEMQFGTNHVGHHFLTRLLLPHMNTQDGRIVCVSSTAHRMAPSSSSSSSPDYYDWESKETYTPWGAYGRSKLANVLMAKSLTHEIFPLLPKNSNMTAVSLHPGVIRSPLWKHTGWLGGIFGRLLADKNVEQGAATNVYCALVDQVSPGAWYKDCQPADTSAMGSDEQLRHALWEYTEKLLVAKGYGKDLPSWETVSSEVALPQ